VVAALAKKGECWTISDSGDRSMAARRKTAKAKSRGSSALELVPDAWERFETFVKSIVSRPAAKVTKSKTKAKSRKKKATGRKTGAKRKG
jgi:hypothetical protein